MVVLSVPAWGSRVGIGGKLALLLGGTAAMFGVLFVAIDVATIGVSSGVWGGALLHVV